MLGWYHYITAWQSWLIRIYFVHKVQDFRFTMHHNCMISKYGAPLSNAVGPTGAFFLAVKKVSISQLLIDSLL